jgi:hypothetical protein
MLTLTDWFTSEASDQADLYTRGQAQHGHDSPRIGLRSSASGIAGITMPGIIKRDADLGGEIL